MSDGPGHSDGVAEAAVAVFGDWLGGDPAAEAARAFLARRGIDVEAARRGGLGYTPGEPGRLAEAMSKKGFSPADLAAAGLVRRDGNGYGDRLDDRLIFPVRHPRGELIGLVGRTPGEDDRPRDLWLPDPAGQEAESAVFGLDAAFDGIVREGHVIVADDCTDVVAAQQAGYPNVVTGAGTGAALNERQRQLLSQHTDLIIGSPASEACSGASPGGATQLRPMDRLDPARFRGEVREETLDSREVGATLQYDLLLPRGAPRAAGEMPLMLFLQGSIRLFKLYEMIDRMIANEMIAPMAVVAPNCGRSYYIDRCDGRANWESCVLQELIPSVRRSLGLAAERSPLVGVGLSMGGSAVLRMAFRRPDLFAAVAATAASFVPGFEFEDTPRVSPLRVLQPRHFLEGLFGSPLEGNKHWSRNHPPFVALENARQIKQSGLKIYFECGGQDEISRDGTMFLAQVLRAAGVEHTFFLRDNDRHNRLYFGSAMPRALMFVSNVVKAAR